MSPTSTLPSIAVLATLLSGCVAPRSLLDWHASLEGESAVELSARGVFVYEPAGAGTDGGLVWRLKGVEASLHDHEGRLVGRQTGETTWEGTDRSVVTGKVLETKAFPSCGAIPWRLYEASSGRRSGLFARTRHVERIFTHGGLAPSRWQARKVDQLEVRVPFGASYRFHRQAEAPRELLAQGPMVRTDARALARAE